MTKDQQFTDTMQHFQAINNRELELFCTRLLPELEFKFATFEHNDYRQGNVTCYLYSHIPDCVFFTVETPMEIVPAMELLRALNQGVDWDRATINYDNPDATRHARIIIELSLSKVPLRVSESGRLTGR